METHHTNCEDLAVAYDVDVVVVGGGPAGVAAAFSAAREGKRTLVIEQFNCLGGVATAGGQAHYSIFCEWSGPRRIVGGIPYEIARRIVDEGYGTLDAHGTMFEVEGLKLILDKMAQECGVSVLYHTFFCESIVDAGAVRGAIIQSKSGRQAVSAKRVVDCTGDGDAAASAGAPFEAGRPADGKCQPVTLMFTIGGVDWPTVQKWRTDYQMRHVWEQAQKNGDMDPFQSTIMGFWWTPTSPDQVSVNFTHMTNVDSTRAEDLSCATIEGRRQAHQCVKVFRKYVRGMENCYMIATPNTVGIRESRRILADVLLTEDDMKAGRKWPDSIGYGSFFIDIHNIDGPGMDTTTHRPQPGFKYQIPYRILVPKGLENILTAGRCVSVTHIALGSIRTMAQCMLTGQAAGTAAAISIDEGAPPRNIDVRLLQEKLRAAGCILTEGDIDRTNAKE